MADEGLEAELVAGAKEEDIGTIKQTLEQFAGHVPKGVQRHTGETGAPLLGLEARQLSPQNGSTRFYEVLSGQPQLPGTKKAPRPTAAARLQQATEQLAEMRRCLLQQGHADRDPLLSEIADILEAGRAEARPELQVGTSRQWQ